LCVGRCVGILAREGSCGRGVERKKEKQRESCRNREEADFLAYFGPDFLLSQAMKSTFIYRRWKRAIISTLEKNFNP
jgi:hypothetical protein